MREAFWCLYFAFLGFGISRLFAAIGWGLPSQGETLIWMVCTLAVLTICAVIGLRRGRTK